MTWQMHERGSGEALWTGVDEIWDLWHDTAETRWAFSRIGLVALAAALLIGGLAAFSPIIDFFDRAQTFGGRTYYWVQSPPPGGCRSLFAACATEPLLWSLLGVVCLAVAGGCYFVMGVWGKPSGWITRRWSLTATPGGLVYGAGPFDRPLDPFQVSRDGSAWSVPIDAVSRVEAGPTVGWQGARRYEGKPFHSRNGVAEIPPAEYQTFLFMADGSRRVIYTANGDCEGAGTLAQSIRARLEEYRARVATKAPQLGADPDREGYYV